MYYNFILIKLITSGVINNSVFDMIILGYLKCIVMRFIVHII